MKEQPLLIVSKASYDPITSLSKSQDNRNGKKKLRDSQHSNKTVDASDEDSSGHANLKVDNHYNVVRNNLIDDDRSEGLSLDLNRLEVLPRARFQNKETDTESRISNDAWTVKNSFIRGVNQRGDKVASGSFLGADILQPVMIRNPNLDRAQSVKYQKLNSQNVLHLED